MYHNIYAASIAPLQSRYSMIDESAPSKGIQVEYLPYDEGNGTQVRTVRLNIFCLSEVEGRTQCSESSGSNTTILECSVHLQMGCPELMVNACWVYFDEHSLVMAIFLWVAAVFILFCGYFAIRATIFLVGVMTGTFASTIFIAQNYHDFVLQSDAVFIFVLCLAVFLGACFGVTLLTLPRLGYFNIGLWVAVTISLMLQNSVYYLTGSLLAFYITLGVLSLLVGVVSLLKFRMFIMVASAIVGSFWVIRPIGFFLPGYPNEFFSGDNFQLSITTPWEFYLYLISIILLIIMGISFQYCLSAKFKKSKHPNAAYYFEDDDPLREKIKKLFQFEGLKEALHSGKEQLVFLKNLVLDSDDEGEENEEQDGQGIEMVEMRERESDESMQRMKKKK